MNHDAKSATHTKRGRRAIAADAQLAKRVGFRLTDAEHRAYLAKVEASGMSASEFFRDCVLTNRTRIVARQQVSTDKKRVLLVVNKSGNNLNQIAHVLNAARLDNSASESTYLAALDTLESIELLLKAHLQNVA
jgi:hypothetical protein